jgi:uncharacterized Zn-binding protein involved in type VI secretion
MPPAARTTDDHKCPLTGPGNTPHEGGPIAPRPTATVFIGYQAAAREGDSVVCKGATDRIKKGAAKVLIEKKPAARLDDPTDHGGKVTAGCPTVKIGDSPKGATVMSSGAPLVEPCEPPEV